MIFICFRNHLYKEQCAEQGKEVTFQEVTEEQTA